MFKKAYHVMLVWIGWENLTLKSTFRKSEEGVVFLKRYLQDSRVLHVGNQSTSWKSKKNKEISVNSKLHTVFFLVYFVLFFWSFIGLHLIFV